MASTPAFFRFLAIAGRYAQRTKKHDEQSSCFFTSDSYGAARYFFAWQSARAIRANEVARLASPSIHWVLLLAHEPSSR